MKVEMSYELFSALRTMQDELKAFFVEDERAKVEYGETAYITDGEGIMHFFSLAKEEYEALQNEELKF